MPLVKARTSYTAAHPLQAIRQRFELDSHEAERYLRMPGGSQRDYQTEK
jgi:hypothetical protein